MKALAEYQSADEIRNDPEIPNIVVRAHTVEAWNRLHENDAPPLPKPDAEERRQFTDIVKTLTAARDEWTLLDARERGFSVWLPTATEKLSKLETETPPDATDDAVDELNRLARRVQLARTFDGNVSGARQQINARVSGAFHALNKLLQKFSAERFPRRFHLAGITPINTINDALVAVECLLK